MLRIFRAVYHFPDDLRSVFPAPLTRLCLPLLAALALFTGTACKLPGPSLSRLVEGQNDPQTAAVCSAAPAQLNSPADTERASVSRSQKPDHEAPRAAAGGSVLDLASHRVPSPENSEVAVRIRATVNGAAILDEEVREAIYPYLLATQNLPEPERSNKRKEIFEKELQQLIEREILLQDMFARLKQRQQILDKLKEAAGKEFDKKMRDLRKRSNIKSDEELKAYLRAQGLSMDGIRRQIERSFMAMEYVRNLIQPAWERIGYEQIAEFYEKHPEEFQIADNVIWQDLFIDASKFPNRETARRLAEATAAKARGGENFLQLIKTHDQGDSSYRNGEGYGHRRGEIKPREAEAILFGLRDGDIGPIVELTNGFHVFRLVKREQAGQKPFDEKTQAAIRNKLQNEAWEREYKRIMAVLKRKAAIEISAQ